MKKSGFNLEDIRTIPPYINYISSVRSGSHGGKMLFSTYEGSATKKATELAKEFQPQIVSIHFIDRKKGGYELIKEFNFG